MGRGRPFGVILEGSSGGVPAETAQRELVEDLHAWLLAIEAAERSCGALQPFYDLFPHHAFLNVNLESAVKSDRRLVWRPGTQEYQGVPRIGVALQDIENDRRHKHRCDGNSRRTLFRMRSWPSACRASWRRSDGSCTSLEAGKLGLVISLGSTTGCPIELRQALPPG